MKITHSFIKQNMRTPPPKNNNRTFLKKLIIILSIVLVALTSSNPKKIILYYDKATSPALLQMINFSHQSENDIKIIFWERFKGKSIGKFKNTYFTDSFEDFIAFSNQIIHKHPTRSVELHFNIHLFTQFYNMQNSLNNTRIKKVHFYEDASNYIWYTPVHEWMFFDLPNAKTFLHIWGDETKLCSSQKPASQCEWVKKNETIYLIFTC